MSWRICLPRPTLRPSWPGRATRRKRELLDRLRASSRSEADDRLDAEAETDLEASLAEIEGDLREAETDPRGPHWRASGCGSCNREYWR